MIFQCYYFTSLSTCTSLERRSRLDFMNDTMVCDRGSVLCGESFL